MDYHTIIVQKDGHAGLITLNRPDAMNALNNEMMDEITHALQLFEKDDDIAAMVITGSEKVFAAGLDIKEIADKTYSEVIHENLVTKNWEEITRCKKPVIAAIAGYALGGGCEVAMMCDIIIAAENAKFGQPEVSVGVIPGAGATQRLIRSVGKSKAMEMCLTGRHMGAQEAERVGLVSRIVEADMLVEEAIKMANAMSKMSPLAIKQTKEAISRSYEMTLQEGLLFERRLFHACFGTEDQKEGMSAFIEKRQPNFKGK